MTNNLVRMVGIRKSYGHVEALRGVDFNVVNPEIVGLIGDNGAGKSTLIKILTGVESLDSGEIYFDNKRIFFKSSADARRAGIETVFQGSGVVNLMSIARNFFLGKEPMKKVFGILKILDEDLMKRESKRVMSKIGITVRSTLEPTEILSGGERQAINIGRAMYFKAKLVILDEPTTALSVKESEHVLEFTKDLRDRGVSVIFITHNIYHIHKIADRFVILNHGKRGGDYKKSDVSINDLTNILKKVAENII